MSVQRRTFLCSLALGGLAAPRLRNAVAIEPIKRTETGGLKLSLAAFSMRSFLQKKPGTEGALDLAVLHTAASEVCAGVRIFDCHSTSQA